MHANVGLVKTFIAKGTIAPLTIVKYGAGDRFALAASAATDKFAGVAALPTGVTAVAEEPIDVIKSGVADVLYGGTVTVGDMLTTDAQGRAIVASAGNNVIGQAQVSGVVGDLGAVLIQFGKI